MWKNRQVAVYRHPKAKLEQQLEQVDLMTLLPERLRERIEAARNTQLPQT